MRIYKIASIDVNVADFQHPIRKKTVFDIGNHLSHQLFEQTDFYNQLTDFEKAYWKKNKAPEFITMDGLEMDQPTGIINVYLAGLPERTYPVLRQYLADILSKDNFRFDIKKELDQSGMFNSKVMRVNILDNPHGRQQEELPPDLNMANINADLVIGKILGYNLSKGYLEVPAFDVLNKANKVTDKQLQDNERLWNRDWTPGHAQVFTGGYSIDDIKISLNKLKEIAQWALDHGYKRLVFS